MALYDTDLFIAGGGPAGLAAAIAARRKGLRVIVADAASPGADKCCGEGLLPDGVEALRELGIAIPANSGRFRGIDFIEGDTTARGEFASGAGFGIRRTELHQLLADEAVRNGAECLFQTRVTGLNSGIVQLDKQCIRPRWILGADGYHSRIREWAGLNPVQTPRRRKRYGFRRHFEIDQAPGFVELHWRNRFQAFITPVGPREVGVAITTRDPKLRVDEALSQLPALRRRLGAATSAERGALTGTQTFQNVFANNVARLGDASGTVDSITGEGMCLAFRQGTHLIDALLRNDLRTYAQAHRRLMRGPRTMASVLLLLADHPALRHAALKTLRAVPALFQGLLAAHTGEPSLFQPTAIKGRIL